MGKTSIQWVHLPGHLPVTWNPIRGCSRVSPGCGGGTSGPGKGGCYAEQIAGRFSGEGQPFEGFAARGKAGARWTGRVELLPEKLVEPLSWREPRCCFVNSMSDLFHEKLTFEEIASVLGVIAACPDHKFLVLTKRAGRMREFFEWFPGATRPGLYSSDSRGRSAVDSWRRWVSLDTAGRAMAWAESVIGDSRVVRRGIERKPPWPLPNLWLGVSAEDQQRWDERVPELLRCPAAVRFVSAEPLLSGIDTSTAWGEGKPRPAPDVQARQLARGPLAGLDQVIVGAESGPGARPMSIEWARSIRDQCRDAGVSFFMKQLATSAGKKIGDMDRFPVDLRIREWPAVECSA